jgi:tRNA A-37 threonylcarbamoyl transferase component Bud32
VDDPASPLPPTVPGLTGLVALARGGYSTVYRAVQVSVGRDVAVKIESRALDSDADRSRFLREARAAGRMSSHSFVVDLFDAGVTGDGHPYLVMELCTGSYADLLKQRTLTAQEARDVGVKIADALADAHKVGVLHRDVKPANILVTEFGEPTLADFGLAVLAEMRDVSMTLDVLTPAYAPREMFRQRCEPSPAADVYSLCATLYTLLSGRPPRWSEERNPSLLTMMELFDRPIPGVPGVPGELIDVLRAGMANDPETRPDAAALCAWLAAVPIGPAVAVTPAPRERPYLSVGPQLPGEPKIIRDQLPAEDEPVPGQERAAGRRFSPDRQRPVRRSTPARAVEPDPETTMPMTRRGQSYGGIAVLVLALGLLAGLGSWYGVHDRGAPALATIGGRPGSPASRSGSVSGSAGRGRASGAPAVGVGAATPGHTGAAVTGSAAGGSGSGGSGSGGGASGTGGGMPTAACGFGPTGAVCPAVPECFDPLTVSVGVARASSVPCDGPHTWQTFAIGMLPAGEVVRYPDVKNDPIVDKLCNTVTLALVDLDAALWQVDVLPPSPQAYAGGDRTFRCLAGTGVNGQSTAAFVH